MAPDNTLQDCDGIADGSAIDSDIIQDYKKGNQMHLQMNPNKTGKKVSWSNLFSTRKLLSQSEWEIRQLTVKSLFGFPSGIPKSKKWILKFQLVL